jgi:hypothetical protein
MRKKHHSNTSATACWHDPNLLNGTPGFVSREVDLLDEAPGSVSRAVNLLNEMPGFVSREVALLDETPGFVSREVTVLAENQYHFGSIIRYMLCTGRPPVSNSNGSLRHT